MSLRVYARGALSLLPFFSLPLPAFPPMLNLGKKSGADTLRRLVTACSSLISALSPLVSSSLRLALDSLCFMCRTGIWGEGGEGGGGGVEGGGGGGGARHKERYLWSSPFSYCNMINVVGICDVMFRKCSIWKIYYVSEAIPIDYWAGATKFRTTKINSDDLIKHFKKISTHENNPLYSDMFPMKSVIIKMS